MYLKSNLMQRDDISGNLMHWVSQKSLQTSSLTLRFCLQSLQNCRKIRVTFALGENLQAIVMISYVLLVNA